MQNFSGSLSSFVKLEAIITFFFHRFFFSKVRHVKCLKQSLAQHSIMSAENNDYGNFISGRKIFEAQRGEITCPGPHSQFVGELGFKTKV